MRWVKVCFYSALGIGIRALGIAFNVDTPNLHIQRHQNRNRYKGAAQLNRPLRGGKQVSAKRASSAAAGGEGIRQVP